MIAKRAEGGHLEGFWEFPGGKQEKGESLKDCLEREIQEELGFKISADRLLLTIVHEYEAKVVSLYVFQCTILAGEPRALECQEFRWAAPEDLHSFDFPPPDVKVIQFLKKIHSNSD